MNTAVYNVCGGTRCINHLARSETLIQRVPPNALAHSSCMQRVRCSRLCTCLCSCIIGEFWKHYFRILIFSNFRKSKKTNFKFAKFKNANFKFWKFKIAKWNLNNYKFLKIHNCKFSQFWNFAKFKDANFNFAKCWKFKRKIEKFAKLQILKLQYCKI